MNDTREPISVLVAEDSPTQAEQIKALLEGQHLTVAIATNGRECLAQARRSKPALIISDVVMPEMDGYELCRAIKADEQLKDVPVVLVTTLSDPDDVLRGLECGADNFIRKPYSERDLLARVQYLTMNAELRRTQKVQVGLEITLGGRRHFISAERQQILDLLISTYEQAVHINHALQERERELAHTNARLEQLVAQRTGELEARERAERLLQDLTDSIPGVLYRLRIGPSGGRFEFLSKSVEAMRGVSQEAAMRDPELVWRTALEEDRAALEEAGRAAMEAEAPLVYDFRSRMPDGTVRWLRTSALHRREPDGSLLRHGYWTDITEAKRLEQALAQAKEEADAANRSKTAFLAMMSHEIRTPLNGVLGMLELLEATPLEAEQRRMVRIVRDSGESLRRIIDDILDISKIEAGKLELQPQATSVGAVLQGLCDTYSGVARSKKLTLSCEVDPAIAPALSVDEVRLRQILGNFVSNALKFTERGGVAVKAELLSRRDNCDRVRFSVIDSGKGIAREEQGRLFQPFTQLKAGRAAGGTGLGLAICQRLAQLMGGTIDLASEPGRGTALAVTLELRAVPPAEAPRPARLAGARPGSENSQRRRAPDVGKAMAEGRLVMVVDDHPTNRLVLTGQLNTLGYAVLTANDGQEALALWQSKKFGLALLDCDMPEMDGFELARRVRALEAEGASKRVPLIACTAHVLQGDAQRCFEAGMDDYIAKPANLRDLALKLDRWLPLPPETPAETDPPIDRRLVAQVSGEDPAAQAQLLQDFRRINDADMVALREALAEAATARAARVVHRIRGASQMIGAAGMAAACEAVETALRGDNQAGIAQAFEELRRQVERLNGHIGSVPG